MTEMFVLLIPLAFVWFFGCMLTWRVASARGYAGGQWAMVSLLLSPALALLALAGMPNIRDAPTLLEACPFCKGRIPVASRTCRWCGNGVVAT